MSNWAIHAGKSCEPLLDLMWREIRSGPVINIDETPVQVMKEPGRSNTNKSYMWVFRGGAPEHPLLLYRYAPSRAGKVPEACLGDYKGYIQTDGYKGYNALGKRDGIVHLSCLAHARRKFLDAAKAGTKAVKKKGYAYHILTHIRKCVFRRSVSIQNGISVSTHFGQSVSSHSGISVSTSSVI